MFLHKKNLYFLFADEEDYYFQDSMLRLNFQDFLWKNLRKAGFTYIYFITPSPAGVDIMCADPSTYDKYCQGRKKRSGHFFGFLRESDGKQVKFSSFAEDSDWFYSWFIKERSRNNGQSAFVFNTAAFQKLFGSKENKKRLTRLIESQRDCKNPIILTSPVRIDGDTLKIFLDKNGIFGHGKNPSQSLCPELYQIIHEEENCFLFDKMMERLGNQFIQLGILSFTRLQSMLRYVFFLKNQLWSNDTLLDYANFIMHWYYKPSVQIRTSLDLPCAKNEVFSYRKWYDYLSGISGWQHLSGIVAAVRRANNGKAIFEIYGNRPDTHSLCYVQYEEQTLQKLFWLVSRIPPDIALAGWPNFCNQLLKPRNHLIPEIRLKQLANATDHLDKAISCDDRQYLFRVMNSLVFMGQHLCTPDQPDSNINRQFDVHLQRMALSKEIVDLNAERAYIANSHNCPDQTALSTSAILAKTKLDQRIINNTKICEMLDAILSVDPNNAQSSTLYEIDVLQEYDNVFNTLSLENTKSQLLDLTNQVAQFN